MKPKSLLKLTRAAVVAALYVALTLTPPLSALSFGALQLRVSEALCVLPMLFPETGIGLILGCLIANLSSPLILPLDLVLGTGATVIAVFFTVRLGKSKKTYSKWLCGLPTVLANALIVPFIIAFTTPDAAIAPTYFSAVVTVGAGEALAAYGLGLPLYLVLNRSSFFRTSKTGE